MNFSSWRQVVEKASCSGYMYVVGFKQIFITIVRIKQFQSYPKSLELVVTCQVPAKICEDGKSTVRTVFVIAFVNVY